ncbi:MAG: cohesin domain-containing protein [Chloroflexota bacterium]
MAKLCNIRPLLTLLLVLFLLLPGCRSPGGLPPPGEGGDGSPSEQIKVELSVSDLPTLGKPVELTAAFAIRESYTSDAPNTTATIELSEGIQLVSGTLKWQGDVVRGKTYQMKVTVKAVKTGVSEVMARAIGPVGEVGSSGGAGYLYISVTDKGASVSRRRPEAPPGYVWGAEQLEPSKIPVLPPRSPPSEPEHPPPPPPPGRSTSAGAGTLSTLTVRGRFWVYVSKNELPPPPQPGQQWQVREDDLLPANWAAVHIYDGNGNYLNGATTSAFGYFTANVSNPGAVGFYVLFMASNWPARVVRLDGSDYVTRAPRLDEVPNLLYPDPLQPEYDIGDRFVADEWQIKGAWRIYETLVNDWYDRGAWDFLLYEGPVYQMPQTTVVFPSDRGDNLYDPLTHKIHIVDENSTKGLDVVQHEYGHAVMHQVYGGWWVEGLIAPHYIPKHSNARTAWVEGWAVFFPLIVQASAVSPPSPWVWEYPSGAQWNIEAVTWRTDGWDDGDDVEGRVAGALWDLTDIHDPYYSVGGAWYYNDGSDRHNGSFTGDVWSVFIGQNMTRDTFLKFWNDWQVLHPNRTREQRFNTTGALFQNTISYYSSAKPQFDVTLQGGARPYHAGLYVPFTIKLYDKNTQLTYDNIMTEPYLYLFSNEGTQQVATDEVVIVSIDPAARTVRLAAAFESVWPDTYNATVVSPYNLINLRNGTPINQGFLPVSMGTLLEGNADNSVQVYGEDFSAFLNDYLATPGSPTSKWNDGRCDFDRDLQVRVLDFTLLAMNYNLTSPRTVPEGGAAGVRTYGTVNLSLNTPAQNIRVGDRFYVTIDAAAGSQSLTGVEAFVNFDPAYLRVVSLTAGSTLPSIFRRVYNNNTAGTVDLSLGTTEGPVSGTFTVGTIRFEAKAATGGTGIVFNLQSPRQTIVGYEGNSVLGTTTNLTVAIQP